MTDKYTAFFETARSAARKAIDAATINKVLNDLASSAVAETEYLLRENQKDLDRMDKKDPKYDRLKLTAKRIEGIAADIRNVASLESPLGHVFSDKTMPAPVSITGTLLLKRTWSIKAWLPRGISTSTKPIAFNKASPASRSAGRRVAIPVLISCSVNTS